MVPVLRELGAEVQCIFSGRKPEDYFDMEVFGEDAIYIDSDGISHKNGSLDRLGTFFNLAGQFPKLMRSVSNLDLWDVDLVISDMEPICAQAARKRGVLCLELSRHVSRDLELAAEQPMGWLDRLTINSMVPSDFQLGLHWNSFGHMNLIPPLLKLNVPEPPETDPDQVLVYLNFERIDDVEDVLRPHAADKRFIVYSPEIREHAQHDGILFKPPSRDGFIADMAASSGLISNAGFNATSEALQLGKDVLVKPLGGHVEQTSNMQVLEHLNLGAGMRELDSRAIGAWLDRQGEFSKIRFPDDTVEQVAAWVMRGNWEHYTDLSDTLWAGTSFETS